MTHPVHGGPNFWSSRTSRVSQKDGKGMARRLSICCLSRVITSRPVRSIGRRRADRGPEVSGCSGFSGRITGEAVSFSTADSQGTIDCTYTTRGSIMRAVRCSRSFKVEVGAIAARSASTL